MEVVGSVCSLKEGLQATPRAEEHVAYLLCTFYFYRGGVKKKHLLSFKTLELNINHDLRRVTLAVKNFRKCKCKLCDCDGVTAEGANMDVSVRELKSMFSVRP